MRARSYLLWKEDGNHAGAHHPTPIFIQPLAPDGLSLTAEPVELVRNDLAWEGDLIEGPYLIKHADEYFLFYSGNNYESADYVVGVARSKTLLSAFEKKGVHTPRGNDVMVYHAWAHAHINELPGREVLLDTITWSDDGWPQVGTDGTPTVSPQATP